MAGVDDQAIYLTTASLPACLLLHLPGRPHSSLPVPATFYTLHALPFPRPAIDDAFDILQAHRYPQPFFFPTYDDCMPAYTTTQRVHMHAYCLPFICCCIYYYRGRLGTGEVEGKGEEMEPPGGGEGEMGGALVLFGAFTTLSLCSSCLPGRRPAISYFNFFHCMTYTNMTLFPSYSSFVVKFI